MPNTFYDVPWCVLVTRPSPHGEELCALLEAQGDVALFFPTLAIFPWHDPQKTKQFFSHLADFSWVIFISPRAVEYARPFFPKDWEARVKIAAMGTGTERALKDAGLSVNLLPEAASTSEALLAQEALHNVHGARILIVKGKDGLNTLSDTLTSRGAEVHHAIVYERKCPLQSPNDALAQEELILDHLHQSSKTFASVVTSSESLSNLKLMLRKNTFNALFDHPLLVPSERIAHHASAVGFRDVHVCHADHQAILNQLHLIRTTSPKGTSL